MPQVFREYPVAARLCATMTRLWADATVELLLRLQADHEVLELAFGGGAALGRVEEISTGAGDTHDGGRSVAIVRFASIPFTRPGTARTVR